MTIGSPYDAFPSSLSREEAQAILQAIAGAQGGGGADAGAGGMPPGGGAPPMGGGGPNPPSQADGGGADGGKAAGKAPEGEKKEGEKEASADPLATSIKQANALAEAFVADLFKEPKK